MKRAAKTTMDRVQRAIDTLPLRRSAVVAAYKHFRETGELPDSQRLADAVARTALNGGVTPEDQRLISDIERLLSRKTRPSLQVITREEAAAPPPSPVREALLHQAVFETGAVQFAARSAIVWLVEGGADVADPQFAASYGMPKHGSVGMHIFGWPRCLVKPPYEAEANRLVAQLDVFREQIDDSDESWWDPFREAMLRFLCTGELPGPGIERDVTLVLEGMDLLMAHRRGVDVAKQVAALDRVWTTDGEERERAVVQFAKLHRRYRKRVRMEQAPTTANSTVERRSNRLGPSPRTA